MQNKHIQPMLSKLKNVKQQGDEDKWTALCPCHDDNNNSLMVSDDNGTIGVHCFAGCDTQTVLYTLGMSLSKCFPEREKPKPKLGKLVQEYDYENEAGELYMQVCRHEPGELDESSGKYSKKAFRQRCPDGAGGWVHTTKGVKKLLYRTPELIASGKSAVIIVEGEKSVDYLRAIGLNATCNAGGAGKWPDACTRQLEKMGCDVLIIPDNDPPNPQSGARTGLAHAERVANKLYGKVPSIHILNLPDSGDKWGADDWLQNGHSKKELVELCASIDEWTPGSPPQSGVKASASSEVESAGAGGSIYHQYAETLIRVGIVVMGEKNDKVEIFSTFHKKSMLISEIDKLTKVKLLQFCGPRVESLVWSSNGECPDDMISLVRIRNSIAVIAGSMTASRECVGPGVWMIDNDVVMVGSGESAVLNGAVLPVRNVRPEYKKVTLRIDSSNPQWFDFDQLCADFTFWDNVKCKSIVEKSDELFGRWKYEHQSVCPKLLTGLVLATWVQTIWSWRPQVMIVGKSESGKTTMFSVLGGDQHYSEGGIFGGLTVKSSDSSAAGIRQSVGDSAKVIICDEFEDGRRRKELMEMFRNSGRGESSLRGTASHKSVEFFLRHMVWAATTESGLNREPDRNRFILIELIRPPNNKMGKLVLPSQSELRVIGNEMMTVAVRSIRLALQLIDVLAKNKPKDVHNRVCDSFAVPASMYAAASGMDETQAVELFLSMLTTYSDEQTRGDEEDILDAILGSLMNVSPGRQETVLNFVYRLNATEYIADAEDTLRKYGMRICTKEGNEIGQAGVERYFFVHHDSVKRLLLRDTVWKTQNIGEKLKWIPGSFQAQRRIDGRAKRGTMIPLDYILDREVSEDQPKLEGF